MTKTDVLNGVASIIENFPKGDEQTLTEQELTDLCDEIAGQLDTVSPGHTYPPTPR